MQHSTPFDILPTWFICFPPHLPCLPMQVDPLSKEQDEVLRKWLDKTPAMAQLKGAAKPGTAASGGKSGGKGDKKDKKKKK